MCARGREGVTTNVCRARTTLPPTHTHKGGYGHQPCGVADWPTFDLAQPGSMLGTTRPPDSMHPPGHDGSHMEAFHHHPRRGRRQGGQWGKIENHTVKTNTLRTSEDT